MGAGSGVVDLKAAADRVGDPLQVVTVGAHAANQQPGQLSLAARSAPRLRDDRRRDSRYLSAREQGPMTGSHPAFALVGCD